VGEKIQFVLGTLERQEPYPRPTIDQVIEVNDSVKDMLHQISINQMFLNNKLNEALKAYLKFHKNDKPPEPNHTTEPEIYVKIHGGDLAIQEKKPLRPGLHHYSRRIHQPGGLDQQ
jgi:hypothetical protein